MNPLNVLDGTAESLHFPSPREVAEYLTLLPGQLSGGLFQAAGHGMHAVEDGAGAHKAFAGTGIFGMIGHVGQSFLSLLGLVPNPDKVIGDQNFLNMANDVYGALTGGLTLTDGQIEELIRVVVEEAERRQKEIIVVHPKPQKPKKPKKAK